MTPKDLHIIYKRDTNKYPPGHKHGLTDPHSQKEYREWLEEKVLGIMNFSFIADDNPEELFELMKAENGN